MAAITMLAGNALAAGAFAAGPFSWATFAISTGAQLAQRALSPRQIVGRIADLSVQSAQEGSPIKEGYGTFSVAGTLVWSNGKTEHLGEYEGGKMGPPPPEYATYTSSFVSLLCASPSGNRVNRPLKIYFNQHLTYDYNGGDQKGGTVSYDSGNGCWSFTSGTLKGKIRIYNGSQTTPDSFVAAAHAAIYDDPNPSLMPAYVDRCVLVAEEIDLSEFGNDVPNVRVVLQSQNTTAKQVFDAICAASSLSSTEYNGAALNSFSGGTDRFGGFVRQDVSPAKDFLQQLSTIFWCEYPTIDGKVTVKLKPGLVSNANPTPDWYLTDRDLRWADNRPNVAPQIEYERASPRELPGRVEYTWTDPDRRYNPAMRRSGRLFGDALKVVQMGVPASMSPGWAKTNSTVELRRQNAESFVIKGMGDPKLYRMACCDITQFTKSDEPPILLRTAQKQTPMFGATSIGFVYHDPSIYSLGESQDTARHSRDDIVEYDYPIIMAADAPPLSDAKGKTGGQQWDDPIGKPGVWVAGTSRKGVIYRGGFFHIVNGSQEINNDARIKTSDYPKGDQKAIMGYVEEDWTINGPSVVGTNPLKVRMYNGDLHTVSDASLLSGANILVFETGRYLQWKTAASTDPLSDEEGWTLTNTRDGIAGSHVAAETIVPANTRFTVILAEDALMAPGVLWLSTELNPAANFGYYNSNEFNPYNLNKVFMYAKKLPDEKARVSRNFATTWYRSVNVKPIAPIINSATFDTMTNLEIDYSLLFRRYFRGGGEPEIGITEPEPFQLQVVISPASIDYSSMGGSNSIGYTKTVTGTSGTFDLTPSDWGAIPGWDGVSNIHFRMRLLNDIMPGRWAYSSSISVPQLWITQANEPVTDSAGNFMEFK